jgi:hypothetical protein
VPTWIETSLQGAVVALSHNGETELAATLARLLDEPEVTSLRLYRSRRAADLADEICDCEDLHALSMLLDAVCSAFAVAHCTVHRVRERHVGAGGTKVVSNYPGAWLEEYIQRGYFGIDPVVARALEGPGQFFWDEVAAGNPIVRGFLEAASEHGVGPAGITFVANTANGDTVAVSLAVPLGPAAFRQVFAPRLSDFTDIAALLVNVFSELTSARTEDWPTLSTDQIRLLKALASGRSPMDLEALPISYGSLATLETSILRVLNATSLVQAVAIAVSHGLLDTVPFFEEDIFRPEHAQQQDYRPSSATHLLRISAA